MEELNVLEQTTEAVDCATEVAAEGAKLSKGAKGTLVAGLAVVTLGLGYLAYKLVKAHKAKKAAKAATTEAEVSGDCEAVPNVAEAE